MDSHFQMVRSGLPGLAEQGLLPQYLIGAMEVGAAAIQGSEIRHVSSNKVYLRTDEDVQTLILSFSKNQLDLLVVAERAKADPLSPQANTRRGGRQRPRRSGWGRKTGGNTVMVEVETRNEPGPMPSPSPVLSPSPRPCEVLLPCRQKERR